VSTVPPVSATTVARIPADIAAGWAAPPGPHRGHDLDALAGDALRAAVATLLAAVTGARS
jgi:hypothetical protein